MLYKILNLIGKDSLVGSLIVAAQELELAFDVIGADKGAEYIDSLNEIFLFGQNLRPDVAYSLRSHTEARRESFENTIKLDLLLNEIARSDRPICLFNHLSERAWTYVFVLHHAEDLPALFKHARPADYFISDTQGGFMLASDWQGFSYVV